MKKKVLAIFLCFLLISMLCTGCGRTHDSAEEAPVLAPEEQEASSDAGQSEPSQKENSSADSVPESMDTNEIMDADENELEENYYSEYKSDFKIVCAAYEIAVVSWKDVNDETCYGLMDYEGNVYCKLKNEYRAEGPGLIGGPYYGLTSNYAYNYNDVSGGAYILSREGDLVYNLGKEYTIIDVDKEKDIFAVEEHIANLNENTKRTGFMKADGTWLVEPCFENTSAVYIGDGYFQLKIYTGDDYPVIKFFNPETGHQIDVDIDDELSSFEGYYDGISYFGKGNVAYSHLCGISLKDGHVIEYPYWCDDVTVSDGKLIVDTYNDAGVHEAFVCDSNEEIIVELPDYKIWDGNEPSIHDDILLLELVGADDMAYLATMSLNGTDFLFEPIRAANWRIRKDNKALIRMMDGDDYTSYISCILDLQNGTIIEELDFDLDSILGIYDDSIIYVSEKGFYIWNNETVQPIFVNFRFANS